MAETASKFLKYAKLIQRVFSFTLFRRFIFSRRAGALIKRLSWISIVQIFLSLFAFVVVLSVMNGMNQSIAERVTTLEPDLVLEILDVKSEAALEIQPIISRLRENPAHEIEVFEQSDVILRTLDGFYRGFTAQGLSPESLESFSAAIQKLNEKQKTHSREDVRIWEPEEGPPGPQEILIGFDAARTLNVFEGDWLTVIPPEALLLPSGEIPTLERVRVKKIITTSLPNLDTQFVWYTKGQALTRLAQSPSRRLLVSVKIPDPTKADELKTSLAQFEGVRITTWYERNGALFAALRLEKFCIGFILFLAGVISSFSVVMALSLLITQKESDWSLLRALGLSQTHLRQLMIKLGLWLSMIGVLSGIGAGTLISLLIQFFPPSILPNIYYDSQIPAQVDPVFILLVMLAASALCYWTCARVTVGQTLTWKSRKA